MLPRSKRALIWRTRGRTMPRRKLTKEHEGGGPTGLQGTSEKGVTVLRGAEGSSAFFRKKSSLNKGKIAVKKP